MMLFIQINFLIAFSYFAFMLLLKVEKKMNVRSSQKFYLRCAQALIILSLAAPVGLKLLPSKRMPLAMPSFEGKRSKNSVVYNRAQKKIETLVTDAPVQVHRIEESYKIDFKKILVFLWLCGVGFFGSKLVLNYLNLKKLLSDSIPMKKWKRLRIVISESVSVPFSLKTFSAYWVVLPLELVEKKKDFELAIKHEIQHHRQGDTKWSIFIEILVCLFYFNPTIYLWKNTIIEYQEFSCDEALTGQSGVLSHDYGSCLIRVAETALINRQVYAGTTSMAVVFKNSKYFRTFLLRRIEMIVMERKPTSKWIPLCTGIMAMLSTVGFAYGVEKVIREKAHAINGGVVVVNDEVQKIADEALNKAVKGTRFKAGFVIVADPMTGKILAVANVDTRNKRSGHWALGELIEPASIAKTFVIAEALEKKVTEPNKMYQCENGKYKYKGKTYRDWKEVGFKELTTADTLAMSSDICAIKIAEAVGDKSLQEMTERFGFGEDGTAKDFPEARVGERPEANEQLIPRMALGYAYKSTPIEIMQAFGSIANGGNLMKPIMGDSEKPEVLRRVLTPENAEKMKAILEGVVLNGTGKGKDRAASAFYTTAGKTASARLNDFMNIDWYGGERPNFAAFVGFAPVKNPRIQVFVGLIDPDADKNKTGAHGGEHAAPVFKEVTENVLALMKVGPDKF